MIQIFNLYKYFKHAVFLTRKNKQNAEAYFHAVNKIFVLRTFVCFIELIWIINLDMSRNGK